MIRLAMKKDSSIDDRSIGQPANSSLWAMLAVAFSTFPILISLPAQILLSNLNEFSLRLIDFLLIFLPAWILSIAVGTGVTLLLSGRIRIWLQSMLLAIGFMFWIQGGMLVWDYGPFDGSDIKWSETYQFGLIDSPIWIVVLLVAAIAVHAFNRIGRRVALVILVAQSAYISLAFASADSSVTEAIKRNYSIQYENQYVFSSSKNVILIVLDAFQSDIFLEIIESDSVYADYFRGFTYFRDAVAGGNYTELAIPALLTGQTYDNSIPRREFLRNAYLNQGITTKLKEEGFTVEIYPWVGWGNESIYFDEAIASNLTRKTAEDRGREKTFTEKKAKEALHLLDLSLFRAVPHFVKPLIYNDQKWFVAYIATYLVPQEVKQAVTTDDEFEIRSFIDGFPEQLQITPKNPVFKYLHFKGAHSPLTVNDDLEFTGRVFPFDRQGYIYQAKANLKALDQLFQKLRQGGIFDDCMIVVLGDHGSGDSPDMYIEPPQASRKPMRLEGTLRNFRRDKARAIPLVLIKPFSGSGELKTSNAPVALTDIPATLMTELGFDAGEDELSMFSRDENASRVRFHGAFEFSPNRGDYVGEITLYRIVGDSWENGSWAVESILHPGQTPTNVE